MVAATEIRECVGAAAGLAGPARDTERLTEDLHLDSMKRLELAVTLEDRLGRTVSDTVVMKAHTVGDLVAVLAA